MLHRMNILNMTYQKNPKNATPIFLIVSTLRHPNPPPQLPPQIQVSHSTKRWFTFYELLVGFIFSCVEQSSDATQEIQFLHYSPLLCTHSLQLDNIDN